MDNGKDLPAAESGFPSRPAFLDYLPCLWSRVLFPGTAPKDAPSGKSWLWLIFIPAIFLYPCLSFHLLEPDEGRYAEIPREMLSRGDWVVPYLLGEPYLDKPPLFYWLVMSSFRLLGTNIWAARLVPALALHGCVLLTYFLGRRSVGARAAFWGALLLSLAPGFLSMGRLLILDGLLAFCVTLSILSGFEALRGETLRRGWWLLSAFACGLALLAKGPVALVLIVPPLLLHRALTAPRVHRLTVGPRPLLAYAAVVLSVVLPWFIAICIRAPAFAAHFLWEHNVVRFIAPFDHIRPVWFYVPILLVGMLPASLWFVPLVRFLLSGKPSDAERRSPELGFLLLAGGWCVFFFSLSGSKLPTYILPAFPLLALAVGAYLTGSRWLERRWVAAPLVLAVAGLAVINYGIMPWHARFHSPLSHAEAVQSYCADPNVPVICYPRNCDSVAFFLGRDDLRSYRSKQTPTLIEFLQQQRRTVIIFTHRHSLDGLREVLPHQLRLTGEVPISGSWRSFARPEMCYMAVVERRE
jgi:4-amino-4-deoxy-L-arabinose transferase-like glycosyltransferase